MIRRSASNALGLIVLLVFAGCGEREIQVYRVPKDAAGAGAPSVSAGVRPAPGILWEAPAHWQEQTPGNVRVGSYLVPGPTRPADFAITSFPGDVGGDLANVNRWRGQLGLDPIDASELPAALERIEAPAGEFLLADLVAPSGDPPVRMLVALFKQPDRTWFFRLTGDDALVAGERDHLTALLQTVRFGAEGRTAPTAPSLASGPVLPGQLPASSLPPGHPPIDPATVLPPALPPGHPLAADTGGAGPFVWSAPPGWEAQPLAPMRLGSYRVRGLDGTSADISITALAGDAGGLLENLNRWREQVELPPWSRAEMSAQLRHLDVGPLHFEVVDFRGPTGQAILGGILFRDGQTWFFKFTGPVALAAEQREPFIDFLRSIRLR
jgi:hypothetical protein